MSFAMRKFFYKKPPDGILPITDNIYLLDLSYSIEPLDEGKFRAYIENVVSQLHEHTPDWSYMGFNFSTDESNQSQISRILSEHKITMKNCSKHYLGCPLLPMETLHNILKSSESWLARDRHMLLMHADHGGWPILAFVLSALLIYLKHYSDEQKTLQMVHMQAPRQLLELLSPLDPMSSQLRYLQYISRRNLGLEWPPVDRAVTLDCLILRMIPDFNGLGELRPMFKIYGQDPLTPDYSNPKLLFSTPKDKKTVRLYRKADSEIVKIDICCHIKGDVVLECINTDEHLQWEEMVFRVMFNTTFIRSNILILNRDKLDVMWGAKERFNKRFRAEILFSHMDLTTTKAVSHIRTEGQYKEEGLPVEAFSKVREYFGHLDYIGKEHTSQSSQKSINISALQKPETDELPTKYNPKSGSDNFTNRTKSLDSEVKTDPLFSSKFEKPNLVTQNPTTPTRLRSTSSEIPSQHVWLAQSSLSKCQSSLHSEGENLIPKLQQSSIELSKEAPEDTPSQLSSSFVTSPRSISANRLDSRSNTFTSADEMHHSSSISISNPATPVSLYPESTSKPNVPPPPPPPPISSQATFLRNAPPPPPYASFAPFVSPLLTRPNMPPFRVTFDPLSPPLNPPLLSSTFCLPSTSSLPPPPPLPPPPNKHSNGFPSPLFPQPQKLVEQLTSERDNPRKEVEEKVALQFELSKARKLLEQLRSERDDARKEVEELRQLTEQQAPHSQLKYFAEYGYSELRDATKNFHKSCKLGEGGFGIVYKGILNNTVVAIKILKEGSSQGAKEFHQEIEILSKVRHPNLVTLIGACSENHSLIYEYLPNGSLEDHLRCKNNRLPLSWQARVRIAFEMCSALSFLHCSKPHGIVHGDLKPDNILLDLNSVSKISDFGLCRQLNWTDSASVPFQWTDHLKGTFAYMDPEYFSTGKMTSQYDVYSFGIMLLQLVTCKEPRGIRHSLEEAKKRGYLRTLIDTSAGSWPTKEAKKMISLGLRCSDPNRKNRPDLSTKVWKELKSMMDVASASAPS